MCCHVRGSLGLPFLYNQNSVCGQPGIEFGYSVWLKPFCSIQTVPFFLDKMNETWYETSTITKLRDNEMSGKCGSKDYNSDSVRVWMNTKLFESQEQFDNLPKGTKTEWNSGPHRIRLELKYRNYAIDSRP